MARLIKSGCYFAVVQPDIEDISIALLLLVERLLLVVKMAGKESSLNNKDIVGNQDSAKGIINVDDGCGQVFDLSFSLSCLN